MILFNIEFPTLSSPPQQPAWKQTQQHNLLDFLLQYNQQMQQGDIPFEDQQFSSNWQSDAHQVRQSIIQLIKKANKTTRSIEQYIENTDCDQLGAHPDSRSPAGEQVDKYNHSEIYYHLYFKMYKANEEVMTHLENMAKKIARLKEEVVQIQKEHKSYTQENKVRAKKKNRRVSADIIKDFECPYDNCYKVYGSDVSLNLHIKIKHGGGNKSDRDKLAEQICLAEYNGTELPVMSFILPPGFLDEYRRKFRLTSRETDL